MRTFCRWWFRDGRRATSSTTGGAQSIDLLNHRRTQRPPQPPVTSPRRDARGRVAGWPHGAAHLPRAPAGCDVRRPAGRRPAAPRSSASGRSSAPTTTSRWASTGCPGPTDSWVTLAGIARETSTIRLGTMMTSATFRYPGPLAISVAQVDQMSGGRVELGIGAGWYDAEHAAYAIPFPLDRRAVRQPRGAAGDPHRAVGARPTARRSPTTARGTSVTDSPGAAEAARSSRTRRSSSAARARSARPALTARYADEFNLPFVGLEQSGQQIGRVRAGLRGDRARPRRPRLLQRAHDLLRRRRGRGRAVGPSPSAAPPRTCARTPSPARPRRSSSRSAGTPRWARSASTSRSSTCTTSTTSACSPPRSCRTSDRPPQVGSVARDGRCRCRGWGGCPARARRTTWRSRRRGAGRRRR